MPEVRCTHDGRGRRPAIRPAASWLVAGAAGLVVLVAAPADGRESGPVALGEVASRVTTSALPDVVELLKQDAQQELAAIDWTRTQTRGRWTVSASVVQLATVREDRTLTAWCTVSATLRDQKTGALVAMIEGRAQADAPAAERALPSAAARAERGALSGAVRGAVTAIPDAIERVRKGP